MLKILIVAGIAWSVPTPCFANFQDGNKLYAKCTSEVDSQQALCYGFVEGVNDTWTTIQRWEPTMPRCTVPAAATVKQIADVVTQYLQQHPEERHNTAASLAMNALTLAFCP
ncbi:exported hypothetical protein [Mesorhizobium metallidurans STM 2683]|uniref:Rap1a immunity protein domain-containing protein n=1 Tax=Mesorhizobium metallidurans STM 2683 TaxID=1297569 RepID=M5F4A5_9HYPH|nr:Rap1a/Tai family immunity protein [Mesorhizobium metallidurans]CCV06706.1 exported hypothetical protein [Mesorhizobium metallidurans STM 2683]